MVKKKIREQISEFKGFSLHFIVDIDSNTYFYSPVKKFGIKNDHIS